MKPSAAARPSANGGGGRGGGGGAARGGGRGTRAPSGELCCGEPAGDGSAGEQPLEGREMVSKDAEREKSSPRRAAGGDVGLSGRRREVRTPAGSFWAVSAAVVAASKP